jgi:hypothetical protein
MTMGSSQAMYLKAGEQPRFFGWATGAVNASNAPTSYINPANNIFSLPIYKEAIYSAFQAVLLGAAAVTGTLVIQGSMDDNTGRGFIFSGNNQAPGLSIGTTNASATITAPAGSLLAIHVGALVVGPGIPLGTTLSARAADGSSGTLSVAATATAQVQSNFYAQNWNATVLLTLSLTGTALAVDGGLVISPWRYVRAGLTASTGSPTSLQVIMGV